MTDEKPFYAHDKALPAARQQKPGELVWTMTKAGHSYRAELRDHAPAFGCDLVILYDGELKVSHLHPDRDWALTEAKLRKEALAVREWIEASTH